MVGVFNWNDLNAFVTLHFDPDLILSLSQGHKDLVFKRNLLTGTTSYSAHLMEQLQLNIYNVRSV